MEELKPDYTFYTDAYHGGAIAETDWPRLCRRASDVLARYKRCYRVSAPDETAESMAVCAMAEAFGDFEGDAALTKAAIGSVSVSYAARTPREREQALYRAACRYLDIYRGAGR